MAGERCLSDLLRLDKKTREGITTMNFYLLINYRIVAIIQLIQSGFRRKVEVIAILNNMY